MPNYPNVDRAATRNLTVTHSGHVNSNRLKHLVEIKYWSAGNIEMAGMEAMAKALEKTGTLKGTVDWNKLIEFEHAKGRDELESSHRESFSCSGGACEM